MPLTLPALFVYIEVKDYIPAAFAGAWIFALAFLQRKKRLVQKKKETDLLKLASI